MRFFLLLACRIRESFIVALAKQVVDTLNAHILMFQLGQAWTSDSAVMIPGSGVLVRKRQQHLDASASFDLTENHCIILLTTRWLSQTRGCICKPPSTPYRTANYPHRCCRSPENRNRTSKKANPLTKAASCLSPAAHALLRGSTPPGTHTRSKCCVPHPVLLGNLAWRAVWQRPA